MTKEQFEVKDKVIKRCKECIKDDGYVRLGYVISTEMGYTDFGTPFYRAISAHLIKSGKYIREVRDNGKDYDVLPNPNYQLVTIQKVTIIIALAVSVFTAWVGCQNLQITKASRLKQNELTERLQSLEESRRIANIKAAQQSGNPK